MGATLFNRLSFGMCQYCLSLTKKASFGCSDFGSTAEASADPVAEIVFLF